MVIVAKNQAKLTLKEWVTSALAFWCPSGHGRLHSATWTGNLSWIAEALPYFGRCFLIYARDCACASCQTVRVANLTALPYRIDRVSGRRRTYVQPWQLSLFAFLLMLKHYLWAAPDSGDAAMQDRANAAKWRLWRHSQHLPGDLQSVLVGEFYEKS